MNSSMLEARLEALEDQRALRQVIHDYLDLADKRRWTEWVQTFTPDATFDLPNSFGLMRGREEIFDVCVSKMEGSWDETQHLIVNADFAVDGDHATGTANILFAALPAGALPTGVYQMGGRYRWQFRREAGRWSIAEAWEEFIWNNGTGAQDVFASSD